MSGTTTPRKDSYDVIVIGGGPAGSTTATLIAKNGQSVLLVDREKFPRFRIGESLMPATYWTLERLGVLERMKKTPFPRKHSVQFFSKTGKSSLPFYFSEIDEHESSVTWQVDRREFDHMLLENAGDNGVDVLEEVNVREILFDGGRAAGIRAETKDGGRFECRCRVVVDASGQSAMMSRKLKLKKVDPILRHAAFFTRYRGAQRDPGIDEGATLILQTETKRTWFWYIPLPDDQVSVGVVGPVGHLLSGRDGSPQQVYDEEVARCPALQPRIANAEQLEPAAVLRDFSYISDKIAGEGWVMAGDAFGFLDPIYSTGVFLALKSAEFAADAVIAAFAESDFSEASLGRNGERYLQGMEKMRKLVYAYYDDNFSIAGFLKAHPQHRDGVVNLLVGNVFRVSTDGLFEAMSEFFDLPESRGLAKGA